MATRKDSEQSDDWRNQAGQGNQAGQSNQASQGGNRQQGQRENLTGGNQQSDLGRGSKQSDRSQDQRQGTSLDDDELMDEEGGQRGNRGGRDQQR